MRLIDADEFVKELEHLYLENGWSERDVHFSLSDTRCNLLMIPTADVQPVVRCMDCKNSRGKIANRTKCGLHNWWVGFDYFCADGERKDDDRA